MTANPQRLHLQSIPVSSTVAVARLTALWALAESALGGVVHALRLPLSGLVMAGTAVILISLIAHFAERPRELLRATLLVLIVKAVGAPHTQLVGYLAVAFQGLFAYCLYSVWRPGRASTAVFAVVALLETAMQKLLTLAIFFGVPLWEAIDEWGGWIIERYFPAYIDAEFSLAMSLVGIYLGIYLIGGLAVGYIAGKLPESIMAERRKIGPHAYLPAQQVAPAPASVPAAARRRRLLKEVLMWGGVAALLAATVYVGAGELSPWASASIYLIRTLAILAVWYFLLGPLLSKWLHRWLLSRSADHAVELERLLDALPMYRALASSQYRELSKQYSGFSLYRHWLPRVLALSLVAEPPRS